MKKTAICIPTFKRAKMVKDTCLKIAGTIEKENFDVYIYDSTPDTRTEEALKELLQNNENFHYIKISPLIHSSKKLYDIHQSENIQNSYNYLWILPDYLFFTKEVVQAVLNQAEEGWDMMMLDFYDPEKIDDRPYVNAGQIFLEYAWSMAQYGLVLLNCDRVLKSADWEYLENKYLGEDYYNFSHITMYFERMIQIPDFRFYHFSVERKNVYISKYRKEYEDLDATLKIWGYRWYKSLDALPAYYDNSKKRATRRLCEHTELLDEKNVAALRIRGVLNKETFGEYKSQWRVVTTVHPIIARLMVYLPISFAEIISRYGSVKGWLLRPAVLCYFLWFCKKYKKIYLYGAGVVAQKYADFMMRKSIPFEGFLVSNSEGNGSVLKGHKVIGFPELEYEKGAGIVIALNEKNKKEILPLLQEKGYGKNVFQINILTPFYRF